MPKSKVTKSSSPALVTSASRTPVKINTSGTPIWYKIIIAAGQLTLIDGADLSQVRVERPKSREHGDWATNIALQLAKKVGKNPREVATVLSDKIASIPGVSTVDIAGPGFLNITLDAAAAGTLAATIVEAGESYGTSDNDAL